MKIFQLQARVQQKRNKIIICFMAQKSRLGLYFNVYFDLSPYDTNFGV